LGFFRFARLALICCGDRKHMFSYTLECVRIEWKNRAKSCTKYPVGLAKCTETSRTGFSDIQENLLCRKNGPSVTSGQDVSTITRAFRERGINRRGENAALVWGSVAGTQGKEKISITTTLEEREETILIATARAGGRDKSAALTPAKIEVAARAFPDLNFENEHGLAQRAIIDRLGTGGRIGLAIGVAGSGKSTLLKPLVHAWREEGRVVYGMALAWRQSDDLADAGIGKENIRAVASFLKGIEAKTVQLTRNSVVVVDEVGLLGTRQFNDILALQKEKKFQLVMIGDPKQMQAVEAGPVIDLLRRALGPENVPELGSSVRQRGAEERETTLMFRNGQTTEALDRKAANNTLHIAPGGYREAVAHVADLWQQRRDENRDRPDLALVQIFSDRYYGLMMSKGC
jgi:ATP-dependent exoDNAse (exonuclease V) alpha subunit